MEESRIELKKEAQPIDIRKRQQLLTDTVAGGMLGGYMEPGFPFYFIDKQLLFWLGYSTQEEYVEDIEGMVENGIHPEDRGYVSKNVEEQLAVGSRYMVDYRMKKQDGSYIWVHDVGEITTDGDGREAIISVCYDISKEKEHNDLLENLLDGLEASVALYRVEKDTVLTLLKASNDVMQMMNFTDEEYWEICKDDAMDFVYAPDRDVVRKTIRRVVREDIVVTEHFRLYNKKGGVTWTTTAMSKFGNENGRPVVRVVFMPISIQNELQLQVLDSNYMSVYVIDEDTYELYYANNTAREQFDIEGTGIAGKSCYDLFYKKESPCKNCWRNLKETNSSMTWEKDSKIYDIEVEKRSWNGRNILIVYGRDITKQYQMQKEAKKNQRRMRQSWEMMEIACAFAGIYVLTYDTVTKTAYVGKTAQQAFGLPEVVKNFPESILYDSVIQPEYLKEYKNQFEKLRAGVKETEMEFQARLSDGNLHWIRLSGHQVSTTEGENQTAVATAQIIDTEKAMEARVETARQKAQKSSDAMFYFIINVTRNEVV
ncbi:MAG: PAS domain-containing protein [Lachnospiraceae bacterium]|nr:PAS domain-containing protein [Lachnospiraceae bacterium]